MNRINGSNADADRAGARFLAQSAIETLKSQPIALILVIDASGGVTVAESLNRGDPAHRLGLVAALATILQAKANEEVMLYGQALMAGAKLVAP